MNNDNFAEKGSHDSFCCEIRGDQNDPIKIMRIPFGISRRFSNMLGMAYIWSRSPENIKPFLISRNVIFIPEPEEVKNVPQTNLASLNSMRCNYSGHVILNVTVLNKMISKMGQGSRVSSSPGENKRIMIN